MESPVALFAAAVYLTLTVGVLAALGLSAFLTLDYLRDRRGDET